MRWIALQARTIEPGAAPGLAFGESCVASCVFAPLNVASLALAQHHMASLALAFTPRVAVVDEAVVMDVTASLRLFGGLRRLVQLLVARLAHFFGSNKLLVTVEYACGATSLIAIGRLRQPANSRAGELPMHTLSAARPHLSVLERTGCRTWDDLLALPRDGVARRFGADLLAALDRARGSAADGYDWLVLPEQFEEKLELDALVIHGPALMAGVERLLVRLQAWLLGRQRGLCALNIIWHLDKRRDVPPTGALVVRTDQPAQDLRHIQCLVAEHLAQQTLAAPVHSLTLQSLVTEPLVDAAAATLSLLMENHQQGGSTLELVERLSARLGGEKVCVWQPGADHRPEDMQHWLPAKSAMQSIAEKAIKTRTGSTKSIKNKQLNTAIPLTAVSAVASPQNLRRNNKKDARTNARTDALYPSWLLPEPMALRSVGNSPVYQGRLQRLAGPQRLESCGWWMAADGAVHAPGQRVRPPAIRDYFIYRSEQAGLLWIYSERLAVDTESGLVDAPPQRAWFLHGFFA